MNLDTSFETSLTQDIQVEGNLRLQGTPYNPVLLGRLNITQGEVNFFGTKYTINQGALTFENPVKMEPVLNVDLETRVQGIDVILTISGPINKLNVTPRSDPPLEMSQVLALLATGSSRSSDPTLVARQTVANQGFTQLGASALIGQVVANPVSSRLVGIRVGWMLALGWGLAAAIGAVAGCMVAPIVFLDPNMMGGILIYAFASATLGGITSPLGAVIGGFLVGVIENLAGTYIPFIGTELKLTVALLIIVSVLLVRPSGLFGHAVVRRV
jgi:hypothetical protein